MKLTRKMLREMIADTVNPKGQVWVVIVSGPDDAFVDSACSSEGPAKQAAMAAASENRDMDAWVEFVEISDAPHYDTEA